jgi:zinc protease
MTALKKIQSAFGVDEYQLPNGLRVLYKEEKAAPVVAVCVTFHVGSRNESLGHTGSTHILEHLLFKDTKHFNRDNGKSPSNYLEWFGAQWNATTWFDRTNYFELMPKERLEEALAIEADKMRNAAFSDEDLRTEMTVVRNEYERGRNNPFELLDEEVMAHAFDKHPYRIPTIGSKEDIENSTTTKLRDFYNTYYWPNNATLTVIGDVRWGLVKKLIEKYFVPIPRSPHSIPPMTITEPIQTKPKSVSLKKPFGVEIVQLGYKIPEGTHKDYPAVLATATILAGGFSSTFQKALVDVGLAADIQVYAFALYDRGFMSFIAHVADGVEPKRVLSRMRKEIALFVKSGPSKEELERAQERILSEIAMSRDGVLNDARAISESTAAGDWMLGFNIEKAIASMTIKEVQRAAKKYLVKTGETSGILTTYYV